MLWNAKCHEMSNIMKWWCWCLIYDSKQKLPALHTSERTIVPRTVIFCIWISVLIISCLAADHVNNIITKELVIGIEIYLPFIRYTQIWKAAVVLVVDTMQSFSRKQQLWSTEIDVGKTGRQLPKSVHHKVSQEMNNDRVTAKQEVNVQDWERELDVDV